MKRLFLSLITMCVIMSCSHYESDEVISTNTPNENSSIESLSSEAQKNFINEICKINQKYQAPKTKISQKDLANRVKWLLNAGVDGIGGAVGGVAFGWLTGAAASTLYSEYLDNMVKQGTRASSYEYVDITGNKEYKELYKAVAFSFCNNSPKDTQDSIGYIHNEILNAFMAKNKRNYISDNKIDFQSFYSDYKKTVTELGYPSEHVDKTFNQDLNDCFNNIIGALASLQANTRTVNDVFNEIELSLYNKASFKKEDAKFLSLLFKNIVLSLSAGIPIEEMPSYSEKINNALKQSELTEENVLMCKSFFQTMICSYIYWKYSKA